MENEVIRRIVAGMPKEVDTVAGGATRNAVSAAPSTNAGEDSFGKSGLGIGRKDVLKQKWDCSQIEEDFGEGDVLDWYEDDEIVRNWKRSAKRRRRLQRGRWKERATK